MTDRYALLKSISQGENGALSSENAVLVQIANDIVRAAKCCRANEREYGEGDRDGASLNELEKRCAEQLAKQNSCWIPFDKIFDFGLPGPSGSESDTYLSDDGFVYKVNNLLHSQDSIVLALIKFITHNTLFPDSAYQFVGFTGFEGRSVYPVVKQRFIKNGRPATQNEIDCYMAACGFEKVENGRYQNSEYLLWDVLPKNVLKDETGDMFVIDVEVRVKEQ